MRDREMGGEFVMRNIILLTAAFLLAAAPARAASANWQEYIFEDDAFAVQFPVQPETGSEPYETSITETLPATTHSAVFDNILFKVRVVPLGDQAYQASNFVIEAAYNLMRTGNVIFNDFVRVGLSGNATYGIGMVVDTEDGRRVRSSFYAENERLYLVDAIVLPERGDLDQALPARFDQTLRLRLDAQLNFNVPNVNQ
jgi:hypothetical protein